MSTALKRMTPQEYLILERQASIKSEFYQGEIFAMVGGSANHSLIAANLVREAGNALKDRPCTVFNSDLRIEVQATGLYSYPNATFACGEQIFDDDHRGKQSNHYRQIVSLKELILFAQDRPHVERFTRQPNGDRLFHEQKEMSAEFELKSLDISVAMSEL